jgi:hypothetical protein
VVPRVACKDRFDWYAEIEYQIDLSAEGCRPPQDRALRTEAEIMKVGQGFILLPTPIENIVGLFKFCVESKLASSLKSSFGT